MKACRSCINWQTLGIELDREDPGTAGQKARLGACRRYAPRPDPSLNGNGAAAGQSTGSHWPQVASDDWCGEWEPDFR